ncbi:DUF1176 domain-containing protein [Porphyrobacter sp. CACIAM 03H1]|uniref:DUF1176 domain-containing protein n=1 Tax=Porphyrobacter sp. CACIAM 03H1 TaxID=2003315 RepID=UPI0012FE0619|nr:DUF1176 domain-containing protein [Porphyrobacter sp. CACIAM 03H1]
MGDLKEFGDWVVGCDNHRACHATSLPEERPDGSLEGPIGDGTLSVSIKALPAPRSAPVVQMALVGEADRRAAARIAGIAIDGRNLGIPVSGSDGLVNLDAVASQKIVDAARIASRIALIDDKGQDIASASLRGWRAAASYIDAEQYRTGTVSSMAAPGDRRWDYSIAPPIPPRPTIVVQPPSPRPPVILSDDDLKALRALDPCQRYTQMSAQEPPRFFRLDADQTLLILPTSCGGYNPLRMPFVIDESGDAREAEFWPYPGNNMANRPELPDLDWSEEERRLVSFGRGRGLADCGEVSEFVWVDGKFRLVHFASMYPCRGSYDYITTYRLDVRQLGEAETDDAQLPGDSGD